MTRLTSPDIADISQTLDSYEKQLQQSTGKTLLGIACHAFGVDEQEVQKLFSCRRVYVIPVTSGEGVISGFSEAVAEILSFLGLDVQTTERSDIEGLYSSFNDGADAVFLSDDNCFAAFNLHSRATCHNSYATGRVYAAALDLLATPGCRKDALVMGCGPVGMAAAEALLSYGFGVNLYDIQQSVAESALCHLHQLFPDNHVHKVSDLPDALQNIPYIVEATPAAATIQEHLLTSESSVVAPGVPPGLTNAGFAKLQSRAIHDKLELGVAGMAVAIFT